MNSLIMTWLTKEKLTMAFCNLGTKGLKGRLNSVKADNLTIRPGANYSLYRDHLASLQNKLLRGGGNIFLAA